MSRRSLLTAGVVVIAVVVLAGAAGPAVAGPQGNSDGAQSAVTVDVEADGSARVTVTSTYDLDDDARADAFQSLRTNETATDAFESRFRERMATVVADAAETTGREMSVGDARLVLRTVDGTGVVDASVTWHGLAAVDGAGLVVTEPFASGFEPDRQVRLVAPAGYEVASVAPPPDGRDGGEVAWAGGSDFEDFEVALEPTDDGGARGGSTTGAGTPGFGVALAVLAVLVGVGALVRRG